MSSKGYKHTPEAKQAISDSLTTLTLDVLQTGADSYLQTLSKNDKKLPTLTGLALSMGIHIDKLTHYRTKYPELEKYIKLVETLQQEYALTRGITNQANPIFSIFLLKTRHGYNDQPQQLTQNNTFNISPDLLSEALKIMHKDKKPAK